MNTKNLKAYAPKARRQFIEAVKKRAAQLGIYEDKITDIQFEGGAAIIEGRAFTKKQGEQRKRLEQKINHKPFETHKERYDLFIREMAYTWFNRLAAIRYMELHDYFDHGFRVLSNPSNPDGLPEILSHASDVADSLALDKSHIIELQLAGDKEEELYRELLLGQCHHLYKIMPFMFEALDDATELLLPNNLTKTDSILKGLINDIPEEDWQKIEVIGWLYQFYISEHKDAVIGKVVKSEDIPAATQLFTPNWIVKYLVQNSVGRQWLATYPDSALKGKMEYYIEPAEQSEEVIEQLKAITPTTIDPEQIKVLDPAAGSGHILVEVYEVLREIYLERGYRLREIPELILTKNIYGLDIDDRAAQLAGFALMMKAREDDRRIFERVERGDVTLNVYSLQSTENLDIPKLWQALNLDGKQQQGSTGGLFDDLADEPENRHPELISGSIYQEYYQLLQTLKSAFLQAKTLGSLIQIDSQHLSNLVALKELLEAKVQSLDPAAKQAAIELKPIIEQAITLAQKYDAVVANPPYMGAKGMNADLKDFAKKQFPNSKADLFAIFMERAFGLLTDIGYNAQVNMQSWMFLSSYEKLREWLLDTKTFVTMAHLGARAFGQISGEVVQTTAWVMSNTNVGHFQPTFFRLVDGSEETKRKSLLDRQNIYSENVQSDFIKIPGCPIAYWVSQNVLDVFGKHTQLYESSLSEGQNITANNDKFLRMHWEVDKRLVEPAGKWSFYSKGGSYRKWFGNLDNVVDWSTEAQQSYRKHPSARIIPEYLRFREGITWTLISSTAQSFRYLPSYATFDKGGSSIFFESSNTLKKTLLFLNSKVSAFLTKLFNATLNLQVDDVRKLPISPHTIDFNEDVYDELIAIAKIDWDMQETAKDFSQNFLVERKDSLKESIQQFHSFRKQQTLRMQELESLNNKYFIDHYGLNEELNPNIELSEVSLELNGQHKFGIGLDEKAYTEKYESSISVELLSYSLGCMMGRFSLDRDGLIYAQSGNEGFKELEAEGAYQTFPADDDGIIPLASEEWLFEDDATTRFKEFVKTVWGDEHLQENLEFVAESLCLHALKPKKGESAMDTIRRYFSTRFFKDHCKTYKKRPIYWLFSSGKEKAFECLVYLHRYNEGTLARMRTEYVTPLMGKYDAQHTLLSEQKIEATGTEARRIEKELKTLEKKQAELRTFDEQLKHYAEKRITLDLDDGVKANYGKFGNLLSDVKAIHGKAVK